MSKKIEQIRNVTFVSLLGSLAVKSIFQPWEHFEHTIFSVLGDEIEVAPKARAEFLDWLLEPDALAEVKRLAASLCWAWMLIHEASILCRGERISLENVREAAKAASLELQRVHGRFLGLPEDAKTTARHVARGALLWDDRDGGCIRVNPLWKYTEEKRDVSNS